MEKHTWHKKQEEEKDFIFHMYMYKQIQIHNVTNTMLKAARKVLAIQAGRL